MIRKILKGVLRAAVAQPWDYMGEGAPGGWEFRVSPDEELFAVFSPARGEWVLFHSGLLAPVDRTSNLDEMDRASPDWTQFLPVEDPDDD